MGWYLRKSIKMGPVRFNISKSGIGTSIGIPGFRFGVRPNGRKYVHAGRHGVYFRQEIGSTLRPHHNQQTPHSTENSDANVKHFSTATTSDLAKTNQHELVLKLNDAYRRLRLDYVLGIVNLGVVAIAFYAHWILGAIIVPIAVVATGLAMAWETNRRTIEINYTLEGQDEQHFQQRISGFNSVASCRGTWALVTSTHLANPHTRKLNAGASNLVTKSSASFGEGTPPWVETNISVPVLTARGQTVYFFPDLVLVYDASGVASIDYQQLVITPGTTRFIEERPPGDATIVDHTWKHPNKNGGPDRRFKDNHEIPVCLYGEIHIKSASGMYLLIMTSKPDAPDDFALAFAG